MRSLISVACEILFNYLKIIFEFYVVLSTKFLAKKYKIDLKLKGPFEPNLSQIAKRPFCS